MMPLDKPLKIRTWNDATHLVFDHLIEHEPFSINHMKMNFDLHHCLRENDREWSESMKKMNKDVQSLKKNFNLFLKEFRGLFLYDPKLENKLHTIIDESDATTTISSKSLKESRLNYDQILSFGFKQLISVTIRTNVTFKTIYKIKLLINTYQITSFHPPSTGILLRSGLIYIPNGMRKQPRLLKSLYLLKHYRHC